MRIAAIFASLFALACGSEEDPAPAGATSPYESDGPHPVGHVRFELTDSARSRTLLLSVWYPAAESAREAATAGEPIANLVPAGAARDQMSAWLDAAPADCPTKVTRSAPDAPLADVGAPFPLIAFSHCHDCIRFSASSIAEGLASHGFVVAAPDHTGNTMFDKLPSLDATFLTVRADDIRFVLDQLLAGAPEVPAALLDQLDPARVGVLGHSFGGVTTGLVLQDDPRPIAGVSIAAPVENPLLAGVSIADIHDPLLLIVAKEDHSIGAIGNDLMRQNFENGNPPMYEVSVEDAGHWSFSDICALTPSFSAGCGQAQRQEDSSQTFEYLPVAQARSIASAYVTAFFSGVILGEAAGLEYVRGAHPSALVEARARE
jgi:predicted dienelactone hydrolase